MVIWNIYLRFGYFSLLHSVRTNVESGTRSYVISLGIHVCLKVLVQHGEVDNMEHYNGTLFNIIRAFKAPYETMQCCLTASQKHIHLEVCLTYTMCKRRRKYRVTFGGGKWVNIAQNHSPTGLRLRVRKTMRAVP
jgi:hypothetical protein